MSYLKPREAAEYCGIEMGDWCSLSRRNLTPRPVKVSGNNKWFTVESLDSWKRSSTTAKPKKEKLLSDRALAKSIASTPQPGEFLIRYDIPFEEHDHRNRYPFDKMEVGGCLEVCGDRESRKMRNAAYQFAKKVNKSNKEKIAFALRKIDNSTKLYRLWRIK